jgi:hypothetical protein
MGFFQRGISAMMTFLGLGFGVSIFVLSGPLVILLPCFKSQPPIEAIRHFSMLPPATAGAQSNQIILRIRTQLTMICV